MLSEEFEFSLSQYADGTLPDERRAEVERRLAEDTGARAALDEIRRLDERLRALTPPPPQMQWDRLAEFISDSVQERARYSIWARRATAWAAAALVFLCVGLFAWRITRPMPGTQMARGLPAAHQTFIEVSGPTAQAPLGPSVLEVAVGRPAGAAASQYENDEGLVVQRPLVSLAAAGPVQIH